MDFVKYISSCPIDLAPNGTFNQSETTDMYIFIPTIKFSF